MKKIIKFACRRSEWHTGKGDIMLPTDIRDLQEPEFLYDEYGAYKLYSDGTRKIVRNEMQVSNSITFLEKERENLYSYWNGCIYSDIDSKRYYAQDREKYNNDYAKKVYYNVIKYLAINYSDNFYYSEVSSSRTSYHFIFNFNCDKTEENFNYYTKLVTHIIKEAFCECGYEDIINFDKVLDDCTTSIHQRLFITKYEYVFNNNCTGNIIKTRHDEVIKREIILQQIEEAAKKMEAIERHNAYEKRRSEGLEYEVHIEKTGHYKNTYIEHHTRYILFKSLYYFYRDNIKDVWSEVAEHIPEENGHSITYYKNCPFRNDWYKKLEDGTTTPSYNRQLLEDFGYKVTYTRKK